MDRRPQLREGRAQDCLDVAGTRRPRESLARLRGREAEAGQRIECIGVEITRGVLHSRRLARRTHRRCGPCRVSSPKLEVLGRRAADMKRAAMEGRVMCRARQ
jgi:hypothetical protein